MRYGVLADVHANLAALRQAVSTLAERGVDEWLCAGDLVGYGAEPNECVDVVRGLNARTVHGNHELLLDGRLPPDRCGPVGRQAMDHTREIVRDDVLAYLASLPAEVELPGLLMTHAAIGDADRYVESVEEATRQLRLLALRRSAPSILLVGHTHVPWVFDDAGGTHLLGRPVVLPTAGPVLVNPGSVGQSRLRERDPLARFMLLDTEAGTVEAFAQPYDVAAARASLARAGLPAECLHQRSGLWPSLRRRVRFLAYRHRRARSAARTRP